MCGFIGFYDKKITEKEVNVIEKGLITLNHRGTDSYGLMLLKDNKVWLFKAMERKDLIEKLNEIREKINEKIDWLIVHNRARSLGQINIDLAHPIWFEDKKENKLVAVMQNGTKKSFAEGNKSDTYFIGKHYFENKLKEKELEGAGVVFIYDHKEKKLLFHKDKSRTLMINTEENLFASEPVIIGLWHYVENTYLTEITSNLPIDVSESSVLINEIVKGTCDWCVKTCIAVEYSETGKYKFITCNKCNIDPYDTIYDSYGYSYSNSYYNKSTSCEECSRTIYYPYVRKDGKKYCQKCYNNKTVDAR